jgi:hypothetical protein
LKRSISLYQHRVRSTELLMSPLDNRHIILASAIGEINSPLISMRHFKMKPNYEN